MRRDTKSTCRCNSLNLTRPRMMRRHRPIGFVESKPGANRNRLAAWHRKRIACRNVGVVAIDVEPVAVVRIRPRCVGPPVRLDADDGSWRVGREWSDRKSRRVARSVLQCHDENKQNGSSAPKRVVKTITGASALFFRILILYKRLVASRSMCDFGLK